MSIMKTSELEAINVMISVLGEAPINTLAGEKTPDVSTAQAILNEVSREVQSKGWHFNQEDEYEIAPHSLTNKISIPANVSRIDVEAINAGSDLEVVQRGEFLYDKKNHTFEFDRSLKVNLIWMLDWSDLPEGARRYIMIRAARVFQDRTLGSEKLSRFTRTDEQMALIDLQHAEGDTGDRTIFDHPSVGNTIRRGPTLGRMS